MSKSQPHPRLVEAEVHNESDDQAVLRVYKNLMKLPTQEARREYLAKFSVPMQQAVHALAKKARQRGESVALSNPVSRHNEEVLSAITPSQKQNIAIAKEWNKANPDDRVPETNQGGLSIRAMGWGGEIPSAAEMASTSDDPYAEIIKRHEEYRELAGFNEPPLTVEEQQMKQELLGEYL